jgi:hypothetical protein
VWQSDLMALRAHTAALSIQEEVLAAREAVVRWRPAEGGSTFFHPAPQIARPTVAVDGVWAPRDEPRFGDVLVGVDADGRPLVVLEESRDDRWSKAIALFVWSAGGFDEIEMAYRDTRYHRYRVVDGRVVHRVSVEEDCYEVALLSWSGGRVVRADIASAYADGDLGAAARTASFGDDDEPLVVHRAHAWVERNDEDAAKPGGDAATALAGALRRAASLHPAEMEWDGRISRPTPLPDDPSELVEGLAVALADAIGAAVTDAAALEPFCVEVRERREGPLVPPVVHIAGRVFRDRMREASGDDMQAIMVIDRRAADGDVVSDDLVDRLDDRALEACRALSTAARWPAATAGVDELIRGLGDRLAELLHARAWPPDDGSLPGARTPVPRRQRGACAGDPARRRHRRARTRRALPAVGFVDGVAARAGGPRGAGAGGAQRPGRARGDPARARPRRARRPPGVP